MIRAAHRRASSADRADRYAREAPRRLIDRTKLGVLGLLLAMSCSSSTTIELPPPLDLSALHSASRRPADLSTVEVKALYVTPRAERAGISADERELALIDLVAVMGKDGALYVTDVLHEDAPAAFGFGKIAREEVRISSPQGAISGARKLFTPAQDALLAIDSGYQLAVEVRGVRENLTFRPLYDAHLYAPYARNGRTPPQSPSGTTPRGAWSDSDFDGKSGENGKNGGSGTAGADGKSADKIGQNGGIGGRGGDGADGSGGSAAGGSGGEGGDGGSGASGGRGTDGEVGGPGEPGPVLEISARPIYSKFYPDETLIYLEIIAISRSGRETRNYVLHRKQRFTVASIGGRGGQGGAGGVGGSGGAGGHGGNGGNGGDGAPGADVSGAPGGDGGKGGDGGTGGEGGDGASGGPGGTGGVGGRGGDGGEIRATVIGDGAFERDVRAFIVLQSLGGEGGLGGEAGPGGNPGAAGSAGTGGDPGDGGRGGSGTPSGRTGDKGSKGKNGDSGSRGDDNAADGRPGNTGPRGRPNRTPW